MWSNIWANGINGLTNASSFEAANDLSMALRERSNGQLGSDARLSQSYQWRLNFQNELTSAIPNFQNQLAFPNGVNGLEDIGAWTEEDILLETTAGARIEPNRFYDDKEWYYQQYEILNLLRWEILQNTGTGQLVRFGVIGLPNNTIRKIGIVSQNTEPLLDWDDCVTRMQNAAWENSGVSSPAHVYYQGSKTELLPGVFQFIAQIHRKQFIYRGHNSNLQSTNDIYAIPTQTNYNTGGNPPYDEFQALAKVSLAGKFNLTDTTNEVADFTYDLYTDDDVNGIFQEPNTGENRGQSVVYTDVYSVCKFDGPNGYTYRDW